MEQPQETEAPESSKKLQWFGLTLTVVWIALVLLLMRTRWGEFGELPPNALGDFAAGVFAPLAFLWLVLGFFQQGEELRNSGRALWLQGRELQHSVEQQRELVNVTREQLAFESEVLKEQREEIYRNSQPILSIQAGGSTPSSASFRWYTFHLINHGKPCTGVMVEVEGNEGIFGEDVLPTGGKLQLGRDLPPSGEIEPFKIDVTYIDERFNHHTKTWLVDRPDIEFRIVENQSSEVW